MPFLNLSRILLLSASVVPFPASAGTNVLPVLNHPVADRSGLSGFPLTVDLNAAFGTEPIDDQVVRFTSPFTSGGVPLVMDMALFRNRTPVTRTNFLKYVTDGDYANSFIHRSVPGFVIQGGGFRLVGSSINNVATDPPIVNEFGVSNTLGTISMAKTAAGPDSATSQWFVSVGANSDNLDNQNGGFTVFGRVTRSTFGNAQIFGNPTVFPIYDYSGIWGDPFKALPLFHTHNYGAVYPNEFILFPTVSLEPLPVGQAGESTNLTYSVLSNSNPVVATASIQAPSTLDLTPQGGQTGTTTITIRATDSVGNAVDDTFVLTVNDSDTYTTWTSRSSLPEGQASVASNPDRDALTNLLEYAFLGDPVVSDQSGLPVGGKTGVSPSPQYLTLTFPVRKFTSGLGYVVEGNNSLSGDWSTVWSSVDGFGHAQVMGAVDQSDRTVVTIKDSAAIGASQRRFLRTRVVQE